MKDNRDIEIERAKKALLAFYEFSQQMTLLAWDLGNEDSIAAMFDQIKHLPKTRKKNQNVISLCERRLFKLNPKGAG